MKIFNWVQRRLNPNQLLNGDSIIYVCLPETEDGLETSAKKGYLPLAARNTGTDMLPEEVDGRLSIWKDGILTIGTFGYEPLMITPQHEQGEDRDHQGLILYSPGGGSHDEGTEDKDVEGGKFGYLLKKDYEGINGVIAQVQQAHIMDDEDCDNDEELIPLILPELRSNYIENDRNHGHIDVHLPGGADTISSSSRNRTTLADLFSAESSDNEVAKSQRQVDNSSAAENKKKKKNEFEKEYDEEASTKTKTHSARSFAKKFINPMSHSARSIKKLDKLMRKMLKKKIHPDMEGAGDSGGKTNNNAVLKLQESDECVDAARSCDQGDDELSLLLRLPAHNPSCSDESASPWN